ncbi:MAG: FtsQ-type POTRA domain-containing protein [Nitrospirae bacterium]|nr:FtsQ-type POTRA domain-containing protein [Nitrospirota bacterium]
MSFGDSRVEYWNSNIMYFYKYKPNKKSYGNKAKSTGNKGRSKGLSKGLSNGIIKGIGRGIRGYAKFLIIILAIVPVLYLADKAIAVAHNRISFSSHVPALPTDLVSSFLKIKSVTLSGNKFVTEEEVSPYLDGLKGTNIFKADIKTLMNKLKEHPWIKDVTVKRELPASILVNILERMPALYISSNGRLYLADEDGVFLGEKPESVLNLPVVYGVSLRGAGSGIKAGETVSAEGMQSALEVKKELTAIPWMDISSSGIEINDSNQVTLHLKEYSIRLGRGEYKEKLRRFHELAKNFRDKGTSFKEVDLRFKNQVIVKEAGT